MSKKVLVTGSNGYIGSYVISALADLGFDVTGVDITEGEIDERAKFIKYNIFCENENIFEELGSPDCLVHLAWKDGFVHNSSAHIDFLPKHISFLKGMISAGCKNISVMGSMHEVGFFEGMIDETTPTNPRSLYGIGKNALRQSLDVMKNEYEFSLKWLRGFYILGDDLRNNSIFTKILQKAKEGVETFPFTTGENKYDFIDIRSLALQIALSSVQEDVTGIINCCSGKPVSLKDKVESFIKENNLNISLQYGAFPNRPYDSAIIYGSNTKIKQVLNNALNNCRAENKTIIENELSQMS